MVAKSKKLPPEWLELHFEMKCGDKFTLDGEIVTVGYAKPASEFRHGLVKAWIIEDGRLQRVITEDEVESCVPSVKEEYLDSSG